MYIHRMDKAYHFSTMSVMMKGSPLSMLSCPCATTTRILDAPLVVFPFSCTCCSTFSDAMHVFDYYNYELYITRDRSYQLKMVSVMVCCCIASLNSIDCYAAGMGCKCCSNHPMSLCMHGTCDVQLCILLRFGRFSIMNSG